MTNVVIDTSERSIEEQLNVVEIRLASGRGIRETFRDFAAGKFAKAPLPEIVKPEWAEYVVIAPHGHSGMRVEAHANRSFGAAVACGPGRETEHDAIRAFNALFGGVK